MLWATEVMRLYQSFTSVLCAQCKDDTKNVGKKQVALMEHLERQHMTPLFSQVISCSSPVCDSGACRNHDYPEPQLSTTLNIKSLFDACRHRCPSQAEYKIALKPLKPPVVQHGVQPMVIKHDSFYMLSMVTDLNDAIKRLATLGI